jgi:hypothetical protein
MNLKSLNAQLAQVRADQAKASARLGDIAAEKFGIESNPAGKAATVAAAEQDLIENLARQELGDPCDVPAAEKRLADAKAQPDDGIATAARLRVLDVLRQRLELEHAALHEKGLAIQAEIRTAEVEALRIQANEIRGDAETAMETIARAESLLAAVGVELNERGANYDLPALREGAVAFRSRLAPNDARNQILAALAA